MKGSGFALGLSAVIITALLTYGVTMDRVNRSLRGVPTIVRDTIYIDLSRKGKNMEREYQIEAFYDEDTETDSFSVYSGCEYIGTVPIGGCGIDSLITDDNL